MDKKGVTIRFDQETTNLCDYWYRKLGFKSRTAFVKAALSFYIAYKNGDYQLPSAEVARLNQLVSSMESLTTKVDNLDKSVNKGFDAILNLSDENLDDPTQY